jgi:dethiobiotin synthetase
VAALFVTATGTDIGKTFVTAELIRELRRQRRDVDAIKPVLSGFDPSHPAGSDPDRLLAALGRDASLDQIERISPFRFRAPLSPDMAARQEGRTLDFAGLVEFCRRTMAGARGTLLIEGAGGVMVPLDERHTVLDWISLLRVPVLLVTGSYLGALSHTLTALHVIAQRGLEIAAVVVSESAGSTVPLAETAAAIARFAAPIEVLALPRLPDDAAGHPVFARLALLVGNP